MCVRIPAFAPAVEQRDDAQLADRALVIVDTIGAKQVVLGVSVKAFEKGVRIGLTLRQAQTLCPDVYPVRSNPARYRRAAYDLMEVLATLATNVEMEGVIPRGSRIKEGIKPAIRDDEGTGIWYMNPGRLRRVEGMELAETIRDMVFEQLHLRCAVGLAANKFTARVAAGSLQVMETLLVPRNEEATFLSPYPITVLPIFPEQVEDLHEMRIKTLGELAKRPASGLAVLLGKQGAAFKRLAEGRDSRPVQSYVPSITEQEIHLFDDPISDRGILYNVISEMADVLAFRLEQRGQVASEVGVRVELETHKVLIGELALRQASGSARHLVQTLMDILGGLAITSGVVEVEVTLNGIVQAEARQLTMFAPESVPEDQLRDVLQRLIARHGSDVFFWADLLSVQSRLPQRRFRFRQVDTQ